MSSSRVPSIPFRNVQPKASHGKSAETSVTAATLQNTSQSFTKNFSFALGDVIGVANNTPIRESSQTFNPTGVSLPGRSLRAFGQQHIQFNKSTQKTFAPKGDRSLRKGPTLPTNPFAGRAATLGMSINAPISELAIAPSVLATSFTTIFNGTAIGTTPFIPGVPNAQNKDAQVFGQNYPMANYGDTAVGRNNTNNVFNSGTTSLLEPNAFAPENDEQGLSYTGPNIPGSAPVLSKGLRAGGYRVAPRQYEDNEVGADNANTTLPGATSFPSNTPYPSLGAILSVTIGVPTTGLGWLVGQTGTLLLTTKSSQRSLIINEPSPHFFGGGVAKGTFEVTEVNAGALIAISARMTSVGFVVGDIVTGTGGPGTVTFTVRDIQTSAEPSEEQNDNPVPSDTLSQINPPAPKTAINDNTGRVQYEFQNSRSSNPSLSIISQDLTASSTKAYFNSLSGEFMYGGFSMSAGGI
jgi:hypothetical protein